MSDNFLPARGTGSAPAHHGEILQGIFHDSMGQLRRALVTLQYPERESRAFFYPSDALSDIKCPPGIPKACRAASLCMAEFATERSPATGGCIEIESTIPRGVGMGSSTADVTAVIRAIADFYGATPPAERICRLAVQAECASDPIMINDRVVLFAQRDGVVLETLGRSLPPMIVVGCDTDPGAGGVDTVALAPARYSPADIDSFRFLRAELRTAVVTGDVVRLGQVATVSALISQRFLRKPALEFLLDVSRSCGGCGVQVAHSGTVAGVILDPRRQGVTSSVDYCVDRMAAVGLPLTGVFGNFQGMSATREVARALLPGTAARRSASSTAA
jgi:uncharacterized protein involved in propanediol utilization